MVHLNTNTFLPNLDNIVALTKSNNVSLYLTLLNGLDQFNGYITNSTQQGMLITNAVIPLVTHFKENTNIFAIDAMNDIVDMVSHPPSEQQ